MMVRKSPETRQTDRTDRIVFAFTPAEWELLLFGLGVANGYATKYDNPGAEFVNLSTRLASLSSRLFTSKQLEEGKDIEAASSPTQVFATPIMPVMPVPPKPVTPSTTEAERREAELAAIRANLAETAARTKPVRPANSKKVKPNGAFKPRRSRLN